MKEKDVSSLIEFNIRNYPERKNLEEYIRYRILKHPYLRYPCEEVLIAEDDVKNIIGQYLFIPARYKFQGKIFSAFWGMDYIVDKNSRNSQAGLALSLESMSRQDHFGLGLSDSAYKLHLAFKGLVIGHMKRFLRVNSYFRAVLEFIFRKQNKLDIGLFPDLIKVSGTDFIKVDDPEKIVDGSGYYNDEYLEFSRDADFLKWRYFYYKDKYVVYKDKNSNSFFAVRPAVWKKMSCLILVDYKMKVANKKMFECILNAAEIISEKMKLSLSLTGCTIPEIFDILSKRKYRSYGKEIRITNSRFPDGFNNFNDNKIFVTFGDSDSDFNYN